MSKDPKQAWPGFSVLIAFGRLGPFKVYRERYRLAILLGWMSIDIFTVDIKSMTVEQVQAYKRITGQDAPGSNVVASASGDAK